MKILVVCLLFCVACGRSGSDVRSNSRFAAVPADSGDRNPVTSATGARGLSLRFDGQVARMGRIMEAGGSTARVFRFVNAGPSPVVIERATATCGCTVAEFSNKPVMPGDSGEIRVTFNPAGRKGIFSANVYVRTSEGSHVLTMAGEVVPRPSTVEEEYPVTIAGGCRLSDGRLFLGRVAQGRVKRLAIGVVNTTERTVSITVKGAHGRYTVSSPRQLAPGCGDSIRVSCDLRNGAVYGLLDDTLTVVVDGRRPGIRIPVRAFAIDDFDGTDQASAPQAIFSLEYEDLGTLSMGTVITRDATLRNAGKSPLTIRSVQTGGGLTTTLRAGDRVAPGAEIRFQATFTPRRRGETTGVATIFHNTPVQCIHEIRLHAVVK
ncbi:MAG: DUF1573 domain-containing protein [Rikenellaceae bacterium]|nr:DUF1573 domain-containing protein [Rikenellaceae bacterium]